MMITGLMFRDGVISGSNNIANNRQAVDALNIFRCLTATPVQI